MEGHGVGMFGDGRLARVGERLLERMAEVGAVHLRKLGGTRAGEMAFGRFLHNGFVTVSEMVKAAAERLAPMVAGRHVLAIQDTPWTPMAVTFWACAGQPTHVTPLNGRRW